MLMVALATYNCTAALLQLMLLLAILRRNGLLVGVDRLCELIFGCSTVKK